MLKRSKHKILRTVKSQKNPNSKNAKIYLPVKRQARLDSRGFKDLGIKALGI